MPHIIQSYNPPQMNNLINTQQNSKLIRIILSTTKITLAVMILSLFLFQIEPALAEGCQVHKFVIEVINLTNQVRSKHNLGNLQFSCRLSRAAQRHAIDMVNMRNLSHTGSNGSRLTYRVEKVGYRFSAIAENIAHGYKTPESVVQGWMKSPGHRNNILNRQYTEIGVGYS